MSTTGDNGSWNPYGNNGSDDGTPGQAPQDPWAQPPASQDPYGQAPASDPYGQSSANSGTDPYGQPSAQNPYGQPSAQDPYGQPSAQDPYGQPSAQDPYGQPPAGQSPYSQPSAQDPYGHGQQSWSAASGSSASASDPYGQPAASGQVPQGEGPSRLVVGLLGIFLGAYGVHRFLMGYTTIGIIQIAVTIVTCGVGSLWGVIEGIMVLARAEAFERDAHGRPLTD